MIILTKTTNPLLANEIFESNVIKTSPKEYRGYAFSDKSFSIKVLQSIDGINFDYVSDFTSDLTGSSHQCGFIVDRLAPYVKFQIINGEEDMGMLRAHIGI